MAKTLNKTIAIYSRKNVELTVHQNYKVIKSNPVMWNGVAMFKADAVYAPDFPKIEKTYLEAGKEIYREDENGVGYFTKGIEEELENIKSFINEVVEPLLNKSAESEKEPESEVDAEKQPEQSEEKTEQTVSDKDWRELPWKNLRGVAAKYSDEPIKNKEQAEAVMVAAEEAGKLV